ncbi:MAG: hypothetical protein GF311_20635 [Candidatus Lokiarchaeota archaeon]|nr:hypothetical protein [Candidatus Lokiarchaeota archaeon]
MEIIYIKKNISLDENTIETFEGYDSKWEYKKWRVDVYVRLRIGERIVEIAVESDGIQHSDTGQGFKAWLWHTGIYKELNEIEDWELKEQKLEEYKLLHKRMRIKTDKFRDNIFEKSDNKFSVRVPTYSSEVSGNRRFKYIESFIIPFLENNYDVDLTSRSYKFDHLDDSLWAEFNDVVFDFNTDTEDGRKDKQENYKNVANYFVELKEKINGLPF